MTNVASLEQQIENAKIWTVDHMTHLQNLESILEHGLYPHNNCHQQVDISNQTVNNRRDRLDPFNQRPVHDYVPFYFNPRNAMLYKATQEHDDLIVILGYDRALIANGIVTDGNAACDRTRYAQSTLSHVDWSKVFSGERWYNNGYYDQELKRQMMAELLVKEVVETCHLQVIFCKSQRVKQFIESNYQLDGIEVLVQPDIFF